MSNGRVVHPGATEQPSNIATIGREIESGRRASRTLERMHRKLGDLPDLPIKMNPIAAIITYSAVGLNDEDIATALGATPNQVATIKESDAYRQLEQMFDQTTFESERRNAKHIISKAASRAAEMMVGLINSDDENIALTAARDVTKLAGISTEEEMSKQFRGLKIVIIDKDSVNNEIKVEVSDG